MNHERATLRQQKRRTYRVRRRIRGTTEQPRLNVFRSHKHIYAQLIDDSTGKTLVSASTLEGSFRKDGMYGGNRAAAESVGKLIAERAVAAGIKRVAFDRGPYKYHGRVASMADGARAAGLEF